MTYHDLLVAAGGWFSATAFRFAGDTVLIHWDRRKARRARTARPTTGQ